MGSFNLSTKYSLTKDYGIYILKIKINVYHEATCHYDEEEDLISSLKAAVAAAPIAAVAPGTSSSASVVFKEQSILRLSVAEHPMDEFLEEKGWLETRKSSLDLPWSRDGIITDEKHWREARQACLDLPCSSEDGIRIDDYSNLKISETLTSLGVPEVSHQSIIDKLRRLGTPGLAPKVVVEILEVTHITLPLVDKEGKAVYPEEEEEELPVQTEEEEEEEEEIDRAQFLVSLKKLIVGAGDINEEDEDTLIVDWCLKLFNAINKLAWQASDEAKEEEAAKEAKEEEEATQANEEGRKKGVKKAKEEEGSEEDKKEAKVEEEDGSCPICMEIFKPDVASWSEMPCCSRVFHCDCISKWTERVRKCPWCRSSLPLVLQSSKGLIERLYSDYWYTPIHPGFHEQLVSLWHLLADKVWWSDRVLHELRN